jgi:hypothetical protein
MEPTGPARNGRPDDRLRVIRDCHEASMPPRNSLRSIRATIPVMPAHSRSKNGVASLAHVAGIHVFAGCVKSKTWMAGTSPAMTLRHSPN